MMEDLIVDCPSCGEAIALGTDASGGDEQEYTEDCPVCCRPMDVLVRCSGGRVESISVSAQ